MQPERELASGVTAAPPFREVFERELDFVWNCLRRFGIPERDLEDEALEVFLRVQGALHEYDPARSIRPWLAGFAYRVACEYRRRPRHRFERMESEIDRMEPAIDAGQALFSPEQNVAAGEERAMVMAALEKVPDERRAVLVMHDIYGHSIPEVAASCDIPLNTAYSRLRLARADFAQALRRLGWRNEP